MNTCSKFLIIGLLTILMGCSGSQTEERTIPEEVRDLENLAVHPLPDNPDTLILHREQAFGDRDSPPIGRIYDIDVDRSGRVFIGDIQRQVIHVYNPNGRFFRQLGTSGKGPGEFTLLAGVQIRNNYLYAYDPNQQKVTVFTLDPLAVDNTISLARNRDDYPALRRAFPRTDNFYVRNDHTYLATFKLHLDFRDLKPWQNVKYKSLVYPLDTSGNISSEKLLDIGHMHTHVGGVIDNIKVFFGRPVIVLSTNDTMYLFEEPDHFLIKVYDPDGVYRRAFYYPHPKIPLTKKSAMEGGIKGTHYRHEFLLERMESIDLPGNWPVLTDMKIDDQNRLWVATTVEDMNVYQWWVLKDNGELVARFRWPRDKPVKAVRNGSLYTREKDETGVPSIVKYKIAVEEK